MTMIGVAHHYARLAEDLMNTLDLGERLGGLVASLHLEGVVALEQALTPVFAKMEYVGIGFDTASLQRYATTLQTRLDLLTRQANDLLREHRAKRAPQSP